MLIGALKTPAQRPLLTALLPVFLMLALCILCSLLFGAGDVMPDQAWRALMGNGSLEAHFIVFELRAPRTIMGIVVGLMLGVSGALMQAVARNPLAEPGLLGISAGSSLAVTIAFVLGASTATLTVSIAQIGALCGCFCVISVARMQGANHDPIRLVLAGAALSSLLFAMTSLLLLYDERAADEIRFWIIGSIAGRGLEQLKSIAPSMFFSLVCIVYTVRPLASLSLGERVAIGLGHNPKRIRFLVVCSVALLVGAATAIAGPVGFVGLVVPFAARSLVGPDIRRTLWLCLPIGPLVLLSADIVSRLVARPAEMPLGVLTAMIGVPVLLTIVRTSRLPTL